MESEQNKSRNSVRVEIPLSVMARVLEERKLTVSDFRCLDCESKQKVWDLCLQACLSECVNLG